MNGFRKLQQRLREEGWYVEWNLPCCQTCAWDSVPFEFEDGTEVDLSKVLFNHSQDCEVQTECSQEELPDGLLVEDGFVCYPPEQQHYSTFCFAGDRQGVKNLKAILPIIEECGCKWNWNQKGDQRIEISWEIE